MELTEIEISPKEFERVAGDAYHGKIIRASLAYDPTFTLDLSGTTASYDALKITATGYADYTQALAVGAYDAVDGQFEIGGSPGANQFVPAQFGPFPSGALFNLVYYVVDSSPYIYGRTYLSTQEIPPGNATFPFPFLVGIG
jgi:hypothetical protein